MDGLLTIIFIPIVIIVFLGLWSWWINGVTRSFTELVISVNRIVKEDNKKQEDEDHDGWFTVKK